MKLLILFFPCFTFASIRVAFLEMKNVQGETVQLEAGGQFVHVAISYKDRWLHAYPPKGVEEITSEELEKIGRIKVILNRSDADPLTEKQVRKFLGKPYDWSFSWGNESIYCAELVGKLLNIEPLPMTFSSAFWPPIYRRIDGLGLSPDDLFKLLPSRGFEKTPGGGSCKVVFQ